MKRFVNTRWSARYEAIRAVKTGFQEVIQSHDLLTSASENIQKRGDVQIILLSIERFSFMSHLFYWNSGQINLIQKDLQEPGIGLGGCVINMDIKQRQSIVWIG